MGGSLERYSHLLASVGGCEIAIAADCSGQFFEAVCPEFFSRWRSGPFLLQIRLRCS